MMRRMSGGAAAVVVSLLPESGTTAYVKRPDMLRLLLHFYRKVKLLALRGPPSLHCILLTTAARMGHQIEAYVRREPHGR